MALGLIDRLAAPDQALAAAQQLVQERPSPRGAPFAEKVLSWSFVRPFIAKQIEAGVRQKAARDHYPAPYAIVDLWREYGAAGAASYEAEARSIGELMCSSSARNLVRVFLLQDRLKALAGKTKFDCRHLHVVGAGVMGGDIAAWAALRGMSVTLQDRSEELIKPALDRAKAFFDRRLKDPRLTSDALARLRADVSGDGARDADVVIEAIFENAEAKQALYSTLESVMKPEALLATNTSSLMIETLAQTLRDPERLVGIHFFNPVAQMQLIEVVHGARTRATIAQSALAFVRKLDKLPLPCKSAPGFVVNRISDALYQRGPVRVGKRHSGFGH